METINLEVRGPNHQIIGTLPNFPKASSIDELPKVQEMLGISNEVFLSILNDGIRFAVQCNLRQFAKTGKMAFEMKR